MRSPFIPEQVHKSRHKYGPHVINRIPYSLRVSQYDGLF